MQKHCPMGLLGGDGPSAAHLVTEAPFLDSSTPLHTHSDLCTSLNTFTMLLVHPMPKFTLYANLAVLSSTLPM